MKLKSLFAIVCSILMMGQALAAGEERILDQSAQTDQSWTTLLDDLSKIEISIGDQKVKGYDPETGMVSRGAVVARACLNQAEVWKQACAKLGDRYTQVAARNGWQEAVVPQAKLRQQALAGLYFPFGEVVAAKATADTAAVSDQVVKELAALGQRLDAVKVDAGALAAARAAADASSVAARKAADAAGQTVGMADKAVTAAEAAASAAQATRNGLAAAQTEAQKSAEAAQKALQHATEAVGVTDRVTGVENKTNWIIGAVAVLILIFLGLWGWGRYRAKQRLAVQLEVMKADTVNVVEEKVQAAITAYASQATEETERKIEVAVEPLRQDVGAIKALFDVRTIVWPEQFDSSIRVLDEHNPIYDCLLQIEGVDQGVPLTITYLEPGYVLVKGVPGHDEKEKVRLDNPRKSRKFNGVQTLVYHAARGGRFDAASAQQQAAA